MKTRSLIYFAIFVAFVCSATFSAKTSNANHPRGGLDNGVVAPDFSLPDTDNQIVTLSDLRGSKNVVLEFFRGRF